MFLADLVGVADAVAVTRSRSAKVGLIAGLLERLSPEEIAPCVGFLSGSPPQGKIGVGWARLAAIDVPHATVPSLSIGDLDRALSKILNTTGPGSTEARARLLGELLGRATAPEADFTRRLLVGELRQGALAGIMTDAIALAAGVPGELVRRAVMLSGDLGEAARVALTQGAEALSEIRLQVLRPLQPMLASTADDLAEAMSGAGPASVEWKIDGIRIQVHRSGNEVRVFTRNLNDLTKGVPEIVAVAKELPAGRFVLDGEALGIEEEGMPPRFQETAGRLGRKEAETGLPIAPWFFDCLHLDGVDLLDRPLVERIETLDRIASHWRVPSIVTEDYEEASKVLDQALAAGHEGVVVKSANSLYQAGRRGKSWQKVKVAKTLDLVVLGAEWGHGRRKGWLSNLHLGARDPSGGFVMVGKTFKGLTDELLPWQTGRFLELETERKGITVLIRPEVVVEVELDGVQVSPRYPGGVALRFARVKRYRPDKSPAEADTIEIVRRMLSRSGE